jgi:O-antigen/teichoic acid export membrane protein
MLEAMTRYSGSILQLLRTRTFFQASLVLSGNLSSGILRFCVSLILAKVLAVETWGYLVLFMTVMDMGAVFCDSGINPTMVRFMAARGGDNPRGIVARCLQLKAVLCVVVFLGAGALYLPFMRIQHVPDSYFWMYPLVFAGTLGLTFITFGLSVFQGCQEYRWYAPFVPAANILRILVIALLLLADIRSTGALSMAFFITPVVAGLLMLPVVTPVLRRHSTGAAAQVPWRELLHFVWPVALLNILAIAFQRGDIFLLKTLLPPEKSAAEVGYYGLAWQIAFVFPLITTALFTVLLPKVSAMKTAAELRHYRRQVLRIYPLILAVCCLGAAIGPLLLSLIFGDTYAPATPIIRLLTLAFGVNLIFNPLSLVFYAVARPFRITAVYFFLIPLLAALNCFLIPYWGITGAGITAIAVRVTGVFLVILWTGSVIRAKEKGEKMEASAPAHENET